MPSITFNFTVEKGQAILAALDIQGYTAGGPDDPLERLKYGVAKMVRMAEKQYRQQIEHVNVAAAMDAVDAVAEDDDLIT